MTATMKTCEPTEPKSAPCLLSLPSEILLQVLKYFAPPGLDFYQTRFSVEIDVATLQKCRLVNSTLNDLVCPILCPIVRLSLDQRSLDRLRGLTSNTLIAKGIRGVDSDLRYRHDTLASSLREYYNRHASEVLRLAMRDCDYHTEFGYYEDDDVSEEAQAHRKYLDADAMLNEIDGSWREYLDRAHLPPTEQRVQSCRHRYHANADHQAVLQASFEAYAAAYTQQARLVSDGSFVRGLAEAFLRLDSAPFVWVHATDKRTPDAEPWDLAENKDSVLSSQLIAAAEWLELEQVEVDDATMRILPAELLTDLPIACHEAGVPLRGFSIGCFPLTKGFQSLFPMASNGQGNSQEQLAQACRGLTTLHIGARGMNCTPGRTGRISDPGASLIDAYIGAVISGPCIESLTLSMTPLRVCDGAYRSTTPDLYYIAGPLLRSMTTTNLKNLSLNSVEINGSGLLAVIERLSKTSLREVSIHSVTMTQGTYAPALNVLRERIVGQGGIDRLYLSTLQGAEFGAPTGLDQSCGMFGTSEELDDLFARIEIRSRPKLLKDVEAWLVGHRDGENPLLVEIS